MRRQNSRDGGREEGCRSEGRAGDAEPIPSKTSQRAEPPGSNQDSVDPLPPNVVLDTSAAGKSAVKFRIDLATARRKACSGRQCA